MAKTKTNEQIFADIRERGMMTEQEMKLLLRRSNAEGKDLLDYNLKEDMNDGYGIPLSEEQGRKALVWLYRQMRKRDKPTGYREDEIIKTAKPSDFTLICFYDDSFNNMPNHYIPVYGLNGMVYRMERNGEIAIVG